MNALRSFWNKYFAWRPAYYKRQKAFKRYLKNHDEFLSGKNPKEFRFSSGHHFLMPDLDTGSQVFDEIFVGEHYKMKPIFEQKIIIDVGANMGMFSLYAHLKWPQARIFSIEANPATFEMLKKNIANNSLYEQIQIFNLAISAQEKKIPFFSTPISGWSSLFENRGAVQGKQIMVDSSPLSAFCRAQKIRVIDYLKMDIEGAEYDAILGDPQFFDIPINEFVIEIDRKPRDQRYSFLELMNCLKQYYRSVRVVTRADADYPLVYCRNFKGRRAS